MKKILCAIIFLIAVLTACLAESKHLQMATRYVQDVSEQTDRVIENSRMYVI